MAWMACLGRAGYGPSWQGQKEKTTSVGVVFSIPTTGCRADVRRREWIGPAWPVHAMSDRQRISVC